MQCTTIESGGIDRPVPGDYRRADGDESVDWIHDGTGLTLGLHRFGRHYTADPDEAFADYHEHLLRVALASGDAAFVERTIEGDPEAMAIDWMREHPDGTVDLEAEELAAWERSG